MLYQKSKVCGLSPPGVINTSPVLPHLDITGLVELKPFSQRAYSHDDIWERYAIDAVAILHFRMSYRERTKSFSERGRIITECP